MCHPRCPKDLNEQKNIIIPDDLLEITDVPSHNEEEIDGYIVVIDSVEVIYFTSDDAYDVWINTEEVYSINN